MSTILLGGVVSLSAAIIGIRFYKAKFVWGSYRDMIEAKNSQTEGHLKGKTIILTGANSGIGKETTRELYRHGARVIMACRNEDETQKVIDNFKSLYPQSNGELLFRRLDLTSFASVKEFVNQITREEKQVHMLINNAAVFAAPIEATSDGFELNVQVNHLSPALLTFLLLPKLQESNSSQSVSNKVIMVSSSLYKYGKIDEELLKKVDSAKITQLCNENRPDKEVYSSTKLVNLLFTRKLSENHSLLKNVEVCLLCPGFTYTRLHRYVSRQRLMLLFLFAPLFAMIMKSSKQGAQTVIGCAMADHVRSDVFYQHCKPDLENFKRVIASDTAAADRVYQLTMQAIKEHVERKD